MAILNPTNLLAAVLVFGLGGAVGTAELVARYRDEPWKAVATLPALSYIAVNALASLGALAAIKAFGWNFGLDPGNPPTIVATHILVAGFGAMALFRSSLFTVRVGTSDVGVGPSSFLTIILNAVDRNVDRRRAAARALSIKGAMKDVSFELAKVALPLACFALMQNVPTDEQQGVIRDQAAGQRRRLRSRQGRGPWTDADERRRRRLAEIGDRYPGQRDHRPGGGALAHVTRRRQARLRQLLTDPKVVPPVGLEPTTPALRMRCSTN